MEKLLEQLKEKVITNLLKDGDTDNPYIIKGGVTLTKGDIIKSIEDNTSDGDDFISGLVMLSLDLFDRNKEDINNIKKV